MDHYDQSICFYAVLLCLIDFDMIDDDNAIVCPNCHEEIELEFDCDCDDDDCDCGHEH